MEDTTWRNPPERKGGRRSGPFSYQDEAALLRGHPGEWKIIREFPQQQANTARSLSMNIRTGRLRAFQPATEWDSRSATERNEKGEPVVNVYAIYLPPPGDDSH